MKVVILTDLEGPSGVNARPDTVGNKIINVPEAGALLTREINASIEGLIAGGADEIVVIDGHGGSNSIDINLLHPRAQLMQIGENQPVCWLDASCDALVQLGAHGMQTSGGYLCHSFNSHAIQRIMLNGGEIGEITSCAFQAAYFGAPTILVAADDVGCAETRAELGAAVETVVTKQAVNRYTAINRPLEAVRRELREKSERALRKLAQIPVPKLPEHFEMLITFMCLNQANGFRKLGIELVDPYTVRLVSDDYIDIMAQRCGWAPGVHNRVLRITPEWRFPVCR